MDNKKLSNNEKLSKMMPWIDEWILETETVSSFNQLEDDLFQKIKTGWDSLDRISMLDDLFNTYGDAVKTVLNKFLREKTLPDWEAIAKEKGNNSLETYMETLWGGMEENGFKLSIEKSDQSYQVECVKCPLADMAREIKGEKWIFELACMHDYYMVEGFNPEITFKRSKTLIEGDECCNHFYTMSKN